MTDQEKITALRDALHLMLCQFTGTPSTLADSNARRKAHKALTLTGEAFEPTGEPVDKITKDEADHIRRLAPWPDFAGNPIHVGDTVVHPSGEKALVAIDKSKDATGQWRAVYENGDSLWLGNQIGPKGMAVIAGPDHDTARAQKARS